MAPPTATKASAPRPRRTRCAALLGLAATALGAVRLSATWSAGFVGAGLNLAVRRDDSALALQAIPDKPAPTKFGRAPFNSYDNFIYRRKSQPGIRMRLQRFGARHHPFYRILVQFGAAPTPKSQRFIEQVGWYDPMKPVDDVKFFKLKADRAMHWLRKGAEPTDMVASLLDRAGLIRRTGPSPTLGEWEYRVPRTSGPEAPEGWSYDGPHSVTWNNLPMHKRRHKGRKIEEIKKLPLIERYGFKGYVKVPLDHDALTDTVAGSELSINFPNTDLGRF